MKIPANALAMEATPPLPTHERRPNDNGDDARKVAKRVSVDAGAAGVGDEGQEK